ncbi:hypothetical protein HIM_09268 [Hirsutella minnesotensis 3608]|uniref:Extracellular membrane protein CFEM domain-containing protein n=1 Tax=Hirsutella minnesotensis 3608 TaxID=1043627 RepID=A0A0F7ZXU5_9HYPO|nr:hypothetical protein HIM_09268 [Hirsutella minnesotensis 3608]
MARKQAVAGFLALTVLCTGAAHSALVLPDDISPFVPACAQGCFLSFLAFNYGTRGHDGEVVPPLAWLCSTRGDYTVGEGAVQCLTAEKSVGSCSQEEGSATGVPIGVGEGGEDKKAESGGSLTARQKAGISALSEEARQTV